MNAFKTFAAALLLSSFASAGCAGPGDEVTGEAEEAAVSLNAVSLNAVSLNAVSLNAVSLNAVSLNAVSLNGLLGSSLNDPNTRKVWEYVVSCALPANQSVTVAYQGTSYTWKGQLGLAPQWGRPNGVCGESCQEWVSACVLARVDYLGKEEKISLRGDKPGLDTTAVERSTYTDREATYYGNIFSAPQRFYACLSPGKKQIPRVCGPSIATCGFDVLGTCDDLCGRPRADGSFPNCHAPDEDDDQGGPGHGCHHAHDEVYQASVTVFLKP